MTTTTERIIEVRKRKENPQAPPAPVIIPSGYMLDENDEIVEAIFKSNVNGADMSSMEINPLVHTKFNLNNKFDAHNFKIIEMKMKQKKIYQRLLEIVDTDEELRKQNEAIERSTEIKLVLAKKSEIEIVQICRQLQFTIHEKTTSQLKSELYAFTDANPNMVENAMTDPDLALKGTLSKAMDSRKIYVDETGNYVRATTKFNYGKTFEDMVKYFKGSAEALKELQAGDDEAATMTAEAVITLNRVEDMDATAIFNSAKKNGFIVLENGAFYYTETKLGKTKEDAIEFLRNNPNILSAINRLKPAK